MLRRLLPFVALAALAAGVPAADAAPKKVTAFYFANVGAPDAATHSCTQQFVLLTRQTDGNECTGNIAAVAGNGFVEDPASYASKAGSYKVDVTRPLTGTVYVAHVPVIAAQVGPAKTPYSLPAYVELDIAYRVDTTKVGTQHIAGVVGPDGLAAPFSFKLPSSLKNKTVKKVSATVDWSTTTGLCALTYTKPYASVVNLPVR